MSIETIELTSIVRNLPDNTVKDGCMQELINLRPLNGALRPVGPKVGVELEPYLVRFIHPINETLKIYLGENEGYLAYWVMNGDTLVSGPVSTTIAIQSDLSFACLHNTLMVSDNINEVTYLLLYSSDTGTYELFTDLLPEMPNIVLNRDHVVADDQAPLEKYVSITLDQGEVMLSEYAKLQKEKADKGYLTGALLVRCAWELVDGTIVRHTIPDLVFTSSISVTAEADNGIHQPGLQQWKITSSFTAQVLQFKLLCTSSWLSVVQSKYKNIIRNLKIYITMPKSPDANKIRTEKTISNIDVKNYLFFKISSADYIMADVDQLSQYVPDANTAEYFLLKEYKLSELTADTFVTIDNETVQDLTTREQMPIDNFSHHKIYGKRLFTYIDRIFLGNVKNTLYKGFAINNGLISQPDLSTTGTPYKIGIEYDLVVSSRETMTVFSGWSEDYDYYDVGNGQIKFHLKYDDGLFNLFSKKSYWGYPDSRATVARVYVMIGNTIKLALTKTLDSHQDLNFSSALGTAIRVDFAAAPSGSLTSGKTSYYDYNRVQATEINNPFYYPAINSYRIGLGRILGMSSNAIALSSGQYGQFPIYCFCSDGIWTMGIGSGETLINTISPLSRHVCSNPGSIIPIDGGTAFVAANGLFIISGAQVVEISEIAEGSHIGRITGTVNYEAIANNPNLYQIKNYLCAATFLGYLSGAKIGYDHIMQELIISNNAYNYSWVYSLKYKAWFKIAVVFDTFIADFPKWYGYRNITIEGEGYTVDNTEIDASSTDVTADSYYPVGSSYTRYDLTSEDMDELIPVHMETRPLKLSTAKAYKMINRLLTEGYINNNDEFPFSVNLFGSPDKANWYKLNNGTTFGSKRPLLIGRSSFSCRYYILVLGGKVDEEAYFTHIEVDFNERYNNKLR